MITIADGDRCQRCLKGAIRDGNGRSWRCSYCNGTGLAAATEALQPYAGGAAGPDGGRRPHTSAQRVLSTHPLTPESPFSGTGDQSRSRKTRCLRPRFSGGLGGFDGG
jgi:hypothetical protein